MKIENTPTLVINDSHDKWSRVYGATKDLDNNRWLFPGYPPFINNVLHDLNMISSDLSFSPDMEIWLDNLKTFDYWLDFAKNFKSPGPYQSKEYQVRGLAELLYNYRWIHKWEAGAGKTKSATEMLLITGDKALVVCPSVALYNWDDEFMLHTNDQVSRLILDGKNRTEKLEQLNIVPSPQILIMTYDTVRLYGIPHINSNALKILARANLPPTPAFKKVLSSINNPEKQSQFAREWIEGRKTEDINQEIKTIIKNNKQWISQWKYKTVILDESHRIKNIQSIRTRTMLYLLKSAVRRYWLTGTLSLGDPRDLYPQLKGLARYLCPENWETFNETYCLFSPIHKHMVVAYRNLHILNRRVNQVSSEQKLKDCVNLPKRRMIQVSYKLSEEQRHDYNLAVNEMVLSKPDGTYLDIPNAAIRLTKLLQICSGFSYSPIEDCLCDTCNHLASCVEAGILPGTRNCKIPEAKNLREINVYKENPKLKAFMSLLTNILDETNNKIIVWANFIEGELDIIEEILLKQKIGYVRVDGSTSSKAAHSAVAKFQSDSTCKIYLGHIHTGIAINLTAAQYTIYYSRNWSLEDRIQSLGRNYRLGQTEKTVVYDLTARYSVEKHQVWVLKQKKKIADFLTKKLSCLVCPKLLTCKNKLWTKGCTLGKNIYTRPHTAAKIIPE
jgi:SNF2 family DNA or RNA helicase